MRASGRAPERRATRSAWSPAHPTRNRDRIGPFGVSISQPSAVVVARPAWTPVRTSPPAAATSPARDRATAAKSARPVDGTCRAATQDTWGSCSAAAPGVSSVTGTPLARARSARAVNWGRWSSDVATTSLPQRSWAIPWSAQKSTNRSPPRTARPAFSEPGG